MKAPQQMLWAAIIGLVLALDDELPDKLNNHHARFEELTEEPCLRRPGTDTTFRSVLDALGDGWEVGEPVEASSMMWASLGPSWSSPVMLVAVNTIGEGGRDVAMLVLFY
jgi:hypothetical protein